MEKFIFVDDEGTSFLIMGTTYKIFRERHDKYAKNRPDNGCCSTFYEDLELLLPTGTTMNKIDSYHY